MAGTGQDYLSCKTEISKKPITYKLGNNTYKVPRHLIPESFKEFGPHSYTSFIFDITYNGEYEFQDYSFLNPSNNKYINLLLNKAPPNAEICKA